MARYAGFIGPSYKVQSVVAASDQCINMIPAKLESGTGAATWVYDPTPGFSTGVINDVGPGWRASYELNNLSYAVIGGELVEVFVDPPSTTNLVTVGSQDVQFASITANGEAGHQVMVANGGGDLYWYDTVSHASGVIVTVEGHVVAYLNGYFIALNTDTSTIYVSALLDGTSWDAGDAAQRNDFPDKWKAMIVRLPDLLLFGTESISVFYNDPSSDFPFVPNPSIAITRGIRAPGSLKLLQGNPIWLADDLTVRYMQGYTPVRISTHAIEFAISQYEDTDLADAFTYNEQGHSCYALNFPTAGKTWVYDLVSDLWHQRGPYNSGTDDFGVLPVNHAMEVDGVQVVGSRDTVSWYLMSQSYSADIVPATGALGDPIVRRRTAPVIEKELVRIVHSNFELFAEVGASSTTGTLKLQYSDDGGQTFNTGTTISAGASGNYSTRLLWWMLGQARNRVYRLTGFDITSPRWIDAFINSEPGTS